MSLFSHKKLLKRKKVRVYLLVASLILLDIILLGTWLSLKNNTNSVPSNHISAQQASFPELETLSNTSLSFAKLEKFFTTLAKQKGAKYAYDVLKVAPIPPNIDMHLLGHVVGDILYKQEGAKGIQICTQDFRNACSHSIVVGLFLDKGEAALPQISQACRKAPGGSGAYTMCFHGLGHGILAYTGYVLEDTVAICKKTGTLQTNDREYIECVGGAIMEIIGGGFHNRTLWEKQSKKYLTTADPLSPCKDELIPDIAKTICYTYLTPHLFQVAGAELGNPAPSSFEKAFQYCDLLPPLDSANRNACFGGFGKEFVVLAKNRDVRKIDQMTNVELKKVVTWCQLAESSEGKTACLTTALHSLYWGGENDRNAAIRFCGIIQDTNEQTTCFTTLIGAVSYYIKDVDYKKEFCKELPNRYQNDCKKIVNT